MGTPYKNTGQNLESPYAKHLSQYPSQSEGFVPNDFGGKIKIHSSTPSKHYQGNNSQSNSTNWRRGNSNNRYYNANRSSGSGGGGSNNGGYQNYQNNYNQPQANRYSNSGNRQQPYHGQKFNKSNNSSRNDYYHPSMLDDPWKDLLERHNAIKNSQITESAVSTDETEQGQQNAITTTTTTTTSDESPSSISP